MTVLSQIKRNPVKRVDFAEISRETERQKRLIADRIKAERRRSEAKAELGKLKAQNKRFDDILAQIEALKSTYDGILETYQRVIDELESKHESLVELYKKSDIVDSLDGLKKSREEFSVEIKNQLKALDSTKSYANLSSFLSESLDGISKMLSGIPTHVPEVDLSKIEDNLEILLDDNTKEWVFDIERGQDGLIERVKAWQTM